MQPVDRILGYFEQVSAVPRGTFNEAGIRAWLQGWAQARGLPNRSDAAGNLLIEAPASPGMEDLPAVILQGHMDMVCQKTSESNHDFTRDPIRMKREGDWLKAEGTTLGADNGIAIALMMALAAEPDLPHPRLEMLLTVEEELGARGALEIDTSLLTGNMLLNLDSEEDGVFTNGCAGSRTLNMNVPVTRAPADPGCSGWSLRVEGLRGGHSGGDINKHRGNANKLMGRLLLGLSEVAPLSLEALKGGTVRNAIPREAEAVFCIPAEAEAACRALVETMGASLRAEFAETDEGLRVHLEGHSAPAAPLTAADSLKIIRFLAALPNGVSQMMLDGRVETSNNIGIMELKETEFLAVSTHRSQVGSCLVEIVGRVDSLAQLMEARIERTRGALPWEPQPDSPLLALCSLVYIEQFGEPPQVCITHGGLECGLLRERYPGLDCLSLGPTITNPHSPDEALFIPSVGRVWTFLTAFLRSFEPAS